MTASDREMRQPCCDEVIAGEYVLGVLSEAERLKVEARLAKDRPFAAMVSRWAENLSISGDDEALHLPPGARSFFDRPLPRATPCDVVFSGRVSGGCWHSLALWRALALASLAVAAGLALSVSTLLAPRSGSGRLVANLAGTGTAVGLVARYDEARGALHVTPVAGGAGKKKSLEVWLNEKGKAPVSLGVLPQTGEGELAVPAALRDRLVEGAVLSVSLEPMGGAPAGSVSGPVIASGAARAETISARLP